MKLFLDDMRMPSDCAKYMHSRIGSDNILYTQGEWFIVKNFEQFSRAIVLYNRYITHISFDHDLDDEHYTPEEYWGIMKSQKSIKIVKTIKRRLGMNVLSI